MRSDASAPIMSRSRAGLEVSALLYSRSSARMVAAVTMYHTGDLEQAAEAFGSHLTAALPRVACAGWRWRSVTVVHELDAMGLPLRRFRLEPLTP